MLVFVRWWLAPLLASVLLVGGLLSIQYDEPEPAVPMESRSIGGGTADLPAGFQAGERFLKQVPLPDHVRKPPQEDPENEVPGDGHDDGLIITQRRESYYGHEHYPLTGGLRLANVHGTPDNPICLCDATFVLWNVSAPFTAAVDLDGSSHVLVDNVTIYGGSILVDYSHNVTITRSLFIDSWGISGWWSEDIVVRDNDIIDHRGPLDFYDTPPLRSECWPAKKFHCGFSGVEIVAGERWLVEYNYFDGEVGVGGTGDTRDVRLRHNTLYNGGSLLVGDGQTEVGWNLVRGWGQHGIHVAGSTNSHIHNNSIILNTEIDLRDTVVDQFFGTVTAECARCIVENNDYIGFGIASQVQIQMGSPALLADASVVWADDNYWGTLHDPRLPPDTWISIENSMVHLSRWETEPVHPVSVGLFLNQQDWPHHYEDITGETWPLPVP